MLFWTTVLRLTYSYSYVYPSFGLACSGDKNDIMIAIDSSSNVRDFEFDLQLKFVADLSKNMNFMKNTTQIGALFYSNAVSSIIGLSESKAKHSLEARLKQVKRSYGRGRVDEAIRYIRTKGFRRSAIRKDATQIGIIITASPGTYIRKSKRQATKARDTGIILIAVGIGDINTEELNAISGTMDGSLQYHFPSARYLSANLANMAYNVCKSM